MNQIMDEINKRLRDDLAARASGADRANDLNDQQASRKLHRAYKILNKAYKLMT